MRSYVKWIAAPLVLGLFLGSGCAKRITPETDVAANNYAFPGALDVEAADIDGDGSVEYVVGFPKTVEIWYDRRGENRKTLCAVKGNHFTGNILIQNVRVHATDIDRDGDTDISVTDILGTQFYLNDGSGNFAPQKQ